jgi:hypothetical protein
MGLVRGAVTVHIVAIAIDAAIDVSALVRELLGGESPLDRLLQAAQKGSAGILSMGVSETAARPGTPDRLFSFLI